MVTKKVTFMWLCMKCVAAATTVMTWHNFVLVPFLRDYASIYFNCL